MKVSNVLFEKIKPEDTALIHLIADWYLKEWHIPAGTTFQILSALKFIVLYFLVTILLKTLMYLWLN